MATPRYLRKQVSYEVLWKDPSINTFVSNLKSLGLTEYEAKVVCTLLLKGTATVSEISEFANIPNTKLYYVLENLENMGIVRSRDGRPKMFTIVEPKQLLSILENQFLSKLHEIQRIKEETLPLAERLWSFHDTFVNVKQNMRILTNRIEILNGIILVKKMVSYVIGMCNLYGLNFIYSDVLKQVTKDNLESGKRGYMIFPEECDLRDPFWSEFFISHKNTEVRVLPNEKIKFNFISGDKIITTLLLYESIFSDDLIGLIVRDEKFGERIEKYFFKMWDKAEPWVEN